jgi:2-polyprenyl-3-methyl-5-hydroxy-6-metoxy-1,4-benzoquinol methylase
MSFSTSIPTDNTVYSKVEYWNNRFIQEDNYEWIADYSTIKPLLCTVAEELGKRLNKPRERLSILMLGCGSSSLSIDMYNDNYKSQVNLDYSRVVIDKLLSRYSAEIKESAGRFNFVLGDMTKLEQTFRDEKFDIILDKCALDALLVEEKDPCKLRFNRLPCYTRKALR